MRLCQHCDNSGFKLCFNYGGRATILQAVRRIAQAVAEGQLQVEEITEQTLQQHLYTAELPDPDTDSADGEVRLSNFALAVSLCRTMVCGCLLARL